MALLVVDDDPSELALLEAGLRAEGVTVQTASGGDEAIALARRGGIAVILCDIRMPRVNGIQVTGTLHEDARTASVPVILMSAFPDGDDVMNGLLAGAIDFIPKPFKSRELLNRLQSILKQSRAVVQPVAAAPSCFVDIDSAGRVTDASPMAVRALALPVPFRRLHLWPFLSRSFDLVPWGGRDSLSSLTDGGFLRTLFPKTSDGRPAFEIAPQPQDDGWRLVLHAVRFRRASGSASRRPRSRRGVTR